MRPTARTTLPLPGTVIDPLYPSTMRRRYMGESDWHAIAMNCLREALDDFFAGDPTVYVAHNLVFYFERGNPHGRRDPDVLVAKGVVGKHLRQSFRVWEEKVLPCALFELASKDSWREDIGPKRRQFARLRIPEYFVFDPHGCFISPVLRGFRSVNGRSVEMKPDAVGSLVSAQLSLRLVPEGRLLRLYDVRTGLIVPTRHELAETLQRRAEESQHRAEELAAEVARLRAEQARSGKKSKRKGDGESL